MQISLYPSYESVFATDDLRGVFFPLCTATGDDGVAVHFVSSTGLWSTEEHEFTRFRLEGGKYALVSGTPGFEGASEAGELFAALEADFAENGAQYLSERFAESDYAERVQDHVAGLVSDDFDLDYYLTSFYSYSINKLCYETRGAFNQYRHVIDEWGAPDESPVVYALDHDDVEEQLDGASESFEGYQPVGVVVGAEFFADGNDELHLFHAQTGTVVVVPGQG